MSRKEKDKANGDKSFVYSPRKRKKHKKQDNKRNGFKPHLDQRRIYGLYVDSKLVYIGATMNQLKVRVRCHVSEAKKNNNRSHHSKILDALEFGLSLSAVEIYPMTTNWRHYEEFFTRMAKRNGCLT